MKLSLLASACLAVLCVGASVAEKKSEEISSQVVTKSLNGVFDAVYDEIEDLEDLKSEDEEELVETDAERYYGGGSRARAYGRGARAGFRRGRNYDPYDYDSGDRRRIRYGRNGRGRAVAKDYRRGGNRSIDDCQDAKRATRYSRNRARSRARARGYDSPDRSIRCTRSGRVRITDNTSRSGRRRFTDNSYTSRRGRRRNTNNSRTISSDDVRRARGRVRRYGRRSRARAYTNGARRGYNAGRRSRRRYPPSEDAEEGKAQGTKEEKDSSDVVSTKK